MWNIFLLCKNFVYFQEMNMVMFYNNNTKVRGICGELWYLLADYLNFTCGTMNFWYEQIWKNNFLRNNAHMKIIIFLFQVYTDKSYHSRFRSQNEKWQLYRFCHHASTRWSTSSSEEWIFYRSYGHRGLYDTSLEKHVRFYDNLRRIINFNWSCSKAACFLTHF